MRKNPVGTANVTSVTTELPPTCESRLRDFKKILVPTDYSELSLAAMEYALTFSRMFGAQIYLLHTLDTIPVLALDAMDLTTESVIYETEKNAKEDLHEFVESRIGVVPNLAEVVRRGIAEEQIVNFAIDEGVDLIIMATHGRSGIAHVLMGSVAEKVVQRSAIPVLTVKPHKLNSPGVSGKKSLTFAGDDRR